MPHHVRIPALSRPARDARRALGAMVGALALAVPPAGAAAASMLTIADGDASVFSAGASYRAAPGLGLRHCDTLLTGAASLLQVEFDDGSALVLSGAGSSVVIDVPDPSDRAGLQFLVSGWAKLTVPTLAQAAPRRLATPAFDVQLARGTVVVHVDDRGGELFVERGSALVDTHHPSGRRDVAVPEGQFYSIEGRAPRHALSKRPAPAFLTAMPRAFRDSLPSLRKRLAGRLPPALVPAAAGAPQRSLLTTELPRLRACQTDSTLRQVQQALQRLGIDVGSADGILGPRTESALRAFQARKGLPPTGMVDADTLRAIDDAD